MKQFQIMNDISNIVFEIADGEYDELVIAVDVDVDGGSMQSEAYQKNGNERKSLRVPSLRGHDLMMLSFDLHEAMKAHTGGNL